jgi:DNA primase
MISEQQLKDLLNKPKNASRKHFVATCIFDECQKENHFFINKETGLWDCKKCGKDGNIFTFLAKVGALHLLQGNIIDDRERLTKFDFQQSIDQQSYEDFAIENKKLPIGSKDFKKDSSEYKYLLSRKFNEIDFELYQPKSTKIKKVFKDYVILPLIQDFEIKGYVGRYIGKDDNQPRYRNSKDTEFSKLLGGFDEINNKTNTLILVEGYFDKISVTSELELHYVDELKCCCTFGKKISDYQIWLILNKTNIKNIILMFDARDAVNDMKKFAFELLKYFNTQIADTGYDNDPGTLSKKEFGEILHNLQTPNQFWLNKIQKKKF